MMRVRFPYTAPFSGGRRRLTAGSLVLTQRMRVQPSPALAAFASDTMGASSNWKGSLAFNQRMRDRDPPPLPDFRAIGFRGEALDIERDSPGFASHSSIL